MSNFMAYAENPLLPTDRRRYVRKPVSTLAYVELDEGNGGIVLNVSEGGLSVQAVAGLMDDVLPRVRFQLTQSPHWIETSARVTWAAESRKLAGLEFIDLSERSRGEIRKWLAGEAPSDDEQHGEEISLKSVNAKEDEAAANTMAVAVEPTPIFIPLDTQTADDLPAPNPVTYDEERSEEAGSEPTVPAAERFSSRAAAPSFGYSSGSASAQGQARDFKFSMIGESASPAADETKTHDLRTIGVFIGLLALVSLAAGWAAGHGTVNKILEKFRANSSAKSGTQEPSTTPAISAARVSEIEVVNLNNQRWTIPFDGPSGASQQGPRTGTPGGSAAQISKQAPGFNTWVLSPPVRSAGTADGNTAPADAPPAIAAESSPAPENSAGSPLVANSIALQSVVPKPEVRQSAGVVKRGDLIHRVEPIYPVLAREQRMQGTVRLNVSLGEDGSVRKVTVLGGPPLLLQAAADAVKQWKYAPTTLDGRPIESDRDVSLVFHL